MKKDYRKSFKELQDPEPPPELFDRIILAIKREEKLRQTKRLLVGFLFLLIISSVTTPLSFKILITQAKNSGIFYFVSSAISDFGIFLALWQDFSLAILESLPVMAIIFFMFSLILFLFTIRFFLYQKKIIFGLFNSQIKHGRKTKQKT